MTSKEHRLQQALLKSWQQHWPEASLTPGVQDHGDATMTIEWPSGEQAQVQLLRFAERIDVADTLEEVVELMTSQLETYLKTPSFTADALWPHMIADSYDTGIIRRFRGSRIRQRLMLNLPAQYRSVDERVLTKLGLSPSEAWEIADRRVREHPSSQGQIVDTGGGIAGSGYVVRYWTGAEAADLAVAYARQAEEAIVYCPYVESGYVVWGTGVSGTAPSASVHQILSRWVVHSWLARQPGNHALYDHAIQWRDGQLVGLLKPMVAPSPKE